MSHETLQMLPARATNARYSSRTSSGLFDAAYDAAVAALGGVMRKRRAEPDPPVQPERRCAG
jgi:hypothetical protein